MVGSRKQGVKWVPRGLISASECFSCANKVDHRHSGSGVSILCRDPCNYKPLRGERRLVLDDIEEEKQHTEFA
ncbi:MAG: hypothetical protein ACE5Z5_11825 [Candidatus Bathyarchaeia archaeon]